LFVFLSLAAVQTQPSWDGAVAEDHFITRAQHQSQDVERTVLGACTLLSCVHATNCWTANFPWFVTHVWNLCRWSMTSFSRTFSIERFAILKAPRWFAQWLDVCVQYGATSPPLVQPEQRMALSRWFIVGSVVICWRQFWWRNGADFQIWSSVPLIKN